MVKGKFVYLPISNTLHMTELFRRLVIKHFQDNKLINDEFARNLLSWKNSGFSIDNSVIIYGSDYKAKESLAQYTIRERSVLLVVLKGVLLCVSMSLYDVWVSGRHFLASK